MQPAPALAPGIPTGPIISRLLRPGEPRPPQGQPNGTPHHRITFSNPEVPNLGKHIRGAAARGLPLAQKDCHADARGAVICGLGPSVEKPSVLNEVRALAKKGWIVFGLKEAITFLRDKHVGVHYSANMDPTDKEAKRLPVYPDVTYCLASSCHPSLFDAVLAGGAKVLVYHSACGYTDTGMAGGFIADRIDIDLGGGRGTMRQGVVLGEYVFTTDDGDEFSPVLVSKTMEVEVYRRLFGTGDTMCGGFTVANRCYALARYMGIGKVVMAGVDFGWRDGGSYYPSFTKAEPLRDVWMNDHGRVDGRPWHTRPDLLASAVDVAWLIKRGEVTVLGDSLAVSLAKRDDEFLKRICRIE